MSAIRGKNTVPELIIRKALHHIGYLFRLHVRNVPERPDLAFPGRRKVIFIHGCFWHRHPGCRNSVMPSTRHDFWEAKLEDNVLREERDRRALEDDGWSVMVIWECQPKLMSWVSSGRFRDFSTRHMQRHPLDPTSRKPGDLKSTLRHVKPCFLTPLHNSQQSLRLPSGRHDARRAARDSQRAHVVRG